jgi:hypothetical protein
MTGRNSRPPGYDECNQIHSGPAVRDTPRPVAQRGISPMSKRKGKRDGVVESKRRDGTIVFSVRLRDATGRQHQEMVGTSAEGWTHARAAEVAEERRVDVRR